MDTTTIAQPYPLFLAEWRSHEKRFRFGRIVYWRRENPYVLFETESGKVQQPDEVYLDESTTFALVSDNMQDLRERAGTFKPRS